MNRVKSFLITLISAAAFICGSFLCSLHSGCLGHPPTGSLLFFGTGLAILILDFFSLNLLLKWAHPDATVLETFSFSICIAFLIYNGTRLFAVNPVLNELPAFPLHNVAFYFGAYLVLFGVSFLYFLVK